MKLVIIGAGPGGYETALKARKYRFEVCLIEAGEVGGTCLNAGCIPTKAYCRSAEILEEIRASEKFGIRAGNAGVDFPAVKSRKDGIVSALRMNVEAMLESAGVTLVRDRAVFRDRNIVSAGGKDYRPDYVIIATGSVPVMPDIPGSALPGVLDSSSLLGLDSVPDSLCIIGGGVIGLEFASIFRSFGSEVTVVEFCREILPRFDAEIARRLRQSLSKRGIKFSLQSRVDSVEAVADTSGKQLLNVVWTRKSSQESCLADKVLVATGRRPYCEGLNVAAAGIAMTEKGAIHTDNDMRTNVPHIYAIGDVNGRQLLAHAAIFQGRKALDAIISGAEGGTAGKNGGTDLSVMPSAVFTIPEAASVGLTEEEFRASGADCTVRKSFYRANGKAVCLGETDGLCKIITARDGKLAGCHAVGPHAADLVQEVSVLMSIGATEDDLRNAVHIHPTLGEILL